MITPRLTYLRLEVGGVRKAELVVGEGEHRSEPLGLHLEVFDSREGRLVRGLCVG